MPTASTDNSTTPTDDVEEQSEAERPYPWTANIEQAWRAFIIDAMANADIDGKVLVENMQTVYEWGVTGKMKGQKSRTSALAAATADHSPPHDK